MDLRLHHEHAGQLGFDDFQVFSRRGHQQWNSRALSRRINEATIIIRASYPMLRCSAIIVTYNSGASIGPCLEALAREDCEIVVVDNASHDETVARVEEFVAWHPVHLVANSENLGFAAAVNQGARDSSGDVLLVLNPDVIAEPGAVKALVQCLENTGASRGWWRAARKRRTTSTRFRIPTAANSGKLAVRGDASQPALAAQSCKPALSLPRRRLFATAGG